MINYMPLSSTFPGSFYWWVTNTNKGGQTRKITMDRNSLTHYLSIYCALHRALADLIQNQGSYNPDLSIKHMVWVQNFFLGVKKKLKKHLIFRNTAILSETWEELHGNRNTAHKQISTP